MATERPTVHDISLEAAWPPVGIEEREETRQEYTRVAIVSILIALLAAPFQAWAVVAMFAPIGIYCAGEAGRWDRGQEGSES